MGGRIISVVPARAWHIREIADRMRQADIDEVFAASGKSPASALSLSYRKSSLRMTGMVDGRPEAMFGVADLNVLAGVGAPWLLGTNAVEENYVAFLRRSVGWRAQLSARYPVLRNFVDMRNSASVRWLKWLGFEFVHQIDLGGHEFSLFEMRS